MQFEADTVYLFIGQLLAVTHLGTFPCQLGEIVGLELNAQQPFVAAHLLDFLFSLILLHDHIAVFVAGKFIEQLLVGKSLSVRFHCPKAFRYGKFRHDGIGVYAVGFHLVHDFLCVFERLR